MKAVDEARKLAQEADRDAKRADSVPDAKKLTDTSVFGSLSGRSAARNPCGERFRKSR